MICLLTYSDLFYSFSSPVGSSHSMVVCADDQSVAYLRVTVQWRWSKDADDVKECVQLTRCVDIYFNNGEELVYLGRGLGQALQISVPLLSPKQKVVTLCFRPFYLEMVSWPCYNMTSINFDLELGASE